MAGGGNNSSKSDDICEDLALEKESRRPGNSAFKQQRLKAWQPILTASSVLPVFFFIGIVFLPIGIGLLVTSNKVQEKVIPYTNCNDCPKFYENKTNSGKYCAPCKLNFTLDKSFVGKVYMYYGLTNFYQNHRRYVRSRDDSQLYGNLKTKVATNCEPFNKANVMVGNSSVSKPVAPCGAVANSMFSDTFKLFQFRPNCAKINNATIKVAVNLSDKNIAWSSDRKSKFNNANKNLTVELQKFAKPPRWTKPIWQMKDGLKNQDFIVWMRVASFPTFRKLHRIIDSGLPAGNYEIEINNVYPVTAFKGEKRVILSTSSWIGGKNPFLGIAYIIVGSLCIICGVVFLFVHLKVRTRSVKDYGKR